MNNLFEFVINQLNDFWGKLDGKNKRNLIIAVVMIIVLIVGLSLFATRKEYVVLYSGLETKDAGEILKKLEEMKVDAKPEGIGIIMVPKELESKIRMQLAAEGFPKSGISGDATQPTFGFGATDSDKKKAYQQQLQNRLQSSIKTMDGVSDAVVTISIPEQDSFVLKEDRQFPTASVLLTLSNDLNKKQIKGIEELVAKSVIGLKPENISIVDSNANILNLQDSSAAGMASSNYEMENQVRDRLQKQVASLLEPIFGKSNSIVSVNVKLDFNKKVSEVTRFEPVVDGEGIAVSINELKEKVKNGTSSSSTSTNATTTTTAQNQYGFNQGSDNGSYDKTSKTVNYEVNQIKDQIQQAQGQIEKLTLSVVINNGSLDDQTSTSVQNLVSKAVGVDEANVAVRGMAFSPVAAPAPKQNDIKLANLFNEELGGILKYVGIGLFVLLILFMIYRTFSKIALAFREMNNKPAPEIIPLNKTATKIFEEVEEISVEQQEHLEVKKRIDDLVDRKPEVAVQQIRTWLNED